MKQFEVCTSSITSNPSPADVNEVAMRKVESILSSAAQPVGLMNGTLGERC